MRFLLTAVLLMEIFHAGAHSSVLVGRGIKKLEDKRYYFVWDALNVLASFAMTLCFFPLVMLHAILHLGYYVPYYHTGYYALRIREWSSISYVGKRITSDFFLTLFDISTHLAMIYTLWVKAYIS